MCWAVSTPFNFSVNNTNKHVDGIFCVTGTLLCTLCKLVQFLGQHFEESKLFIIGETEAKDRAVPSSRSHRQ